jgi:hypothetical protein
VLTLFKDAILFKSLCAVSSAARALLTSAVISSTDAPCLLLLVNGHANFMQQSNAPLLTLFQGSLHRIEVALNDCDLPRIRNVSTILLCSSCPILKAEAIRRCQVMCILDSPRIPVGQYSTAPSQRRLSFPRQGVSSPNGSADSVLLVVVQRPA